MAEFDSFLAAIRTIESGTPAGNYGAIGGPTPGMGRARGAYQIMESNWDPWARESGIAGADWRDPAAQDHVARFKFGQYMESYGDYRLAAIAWFAGPGAADRAAQQGIGAVGGIADSHNGTTVNQYVDKLVTLMGEYSQGGISFGELQTGAAEAGFEPGSDEINPEQFVAAMLGNVSRMVAGGVPGEGEIPIASEANRQQLGQALENEIEPEFDPETGAMTHPVTGEPIEYGPGFSSTRTPANHTHSTNEARLNDPQYQEIAAMVTDTVVPEITEQFPGLSFGQHRDLGVRPPGGAQFSDHYWGGALDLSGSTAELDAVASYLETNRERLGISYILWRVPNHAPGDNPHVHVSFLPPGSEGNLTHGHDHQEPGAPADPAAGDPSGRGVGGGTVTPRPTPVRPPSTVGTERGL